MQMTGATIEMSEKIGNNIQRIAQNQKDRVNGILAPALIECCAEENTVTVGFRPQEWELNPRDHLHGGLCATMFDLTMGMLAVWRCGAETGVTTAELAVSYIRPIFLEDQVFIKAVVKSAGNSLLRLQGDLFAGSPAKLAATATSVYMRYLKKA